MNLQPYSGNYRVLEKHFNNEISISSYKLKVRILKDKIKEYKCE